MPKDDAYERSHPASLSSRGGRGGLYDGFEAYKTPTDDDYRNVLNDGLIVPDTSVFLNLYRYNKQTRNDLLSVMRSFRNRLFVPHQVMDEFWRNRETVLRDPLRARVTAKELSNHRAQAVGYISSWASQTGLTQEQIQEFNRLISAGFGEVLERIARIADEDGVGFANDTGADPVLAELEPLLRGRVGDRLAESDYEQAITEARRRVGAKIPPGYMDRAKSGDRAAGDYLIWLQVILEAKSQGRNVLIVTGDVKEDWWRREHGELRGPRPELVQELKREASVDLFLFRPESLLLHARRFLQVNIQDESVQDVERVGTSAEADDGAEFGADLVRRSWDEILESIKARSKVAWLLLTNASVTDVSGYKITVEFLRPSDAEAFMKRGLDRVLSEAMNEFFDVEPEVIVTPLGSGR